MTADVWTFVISIFFLPVWAVLEALRLGQRADGVSVALISMVMRERGYQMNSLPFFWSAMMAHFWWNWLGKTWSTPYPGIAFWLLVATTLGMDIWLWNTPFNTLHPVLKFFRAPPMQCVLGFASALTLFPQQMLRPGPGWRWW